MPPGTPKSMKIDQIMEGHVQQIWGHVFCQTQKLCGRTLGRKGLVKCHGIIKDLKNASFDSLESFSESYSAIWDDLCN